jgi:CBS domain-containing membrane protein
MLDALKNYLGFEPYNVSHAERLVSALGAFTGIYLIYVCSHFFLDDVSSYLIVASMGASAVLLFAVPHGRLSQPWAVVGGHLVSAVVGVTCARYIPGTFISAAAAVGLAVGCMYYLHCIHPPGGATAITAVIGGEQVLDLGYQYVLTPVALNALIILIIAILFNFFFKWRQYPQALYAACHARRKRTDTAISSDTRSSEHDFITHEDFVYALSEIDSLIDISESDLLRIYDLVTKRYQDKRSFHELVPGHYYSNGAYGQDWAVRQIIDWGETENDETQLIYKVVAGVGRRSTGVCSKREFLSWAKHEVERDEENWRRVVNPAE